MSEQLFTPEDLQAIQQRGSELATVNEQLRRFKEGFDFTAIASACVVGDGIIRLSETQQDQYLAQYEAALPSKKVVKFVPASGAASRMFKHLFSAKDNWDKMDKTSGEGLLAQKFVDGLSDFAFHEELTQVASTSGVSAADLKSNVPQLMEFVLEEKGLNYGNLPKAMIKFHIDKGRSKASIEEHFIEAAGYAADADNVCRIHFTVSPEHMAPVSKKCEEVKPLYEQEFGVTYDISYSSQKKSTDTIAVDMDNQPFRNDDGSILFRPAGHGALIENLNDIDADIVFLKNIDNVLPDNRKADTLRWKKVLGGVLIELAAKIAATKAALEADAMPLEEAVVFCSAHLGIKLAQPTLQSVKDVLDRPIRVCGMVVNEGEPGGGPFWVKQGNGDISLQVVESAQIDLSNEAQATIMQGSTHFNPVDVVCAVKDGNGQPFDLLKFVDYDTGFITEKSKDGKALKAQELPGLWNGSMAKWNTVFVEVPASTFSPVKTVNDLLKPVHQS